MIPIALEKQVSGNTAFGDSIYDQIELPNEGSPYREILVGDAERMKLTADRIDSHYQSRSPFAIRLAGNGRPDNDTRDGSVIDLQSAFRAKVVGKRSIHTLKEWEGVIDTVEDDIVKARLADLSENKNVYSSADIPLSIVDRHERKKAVPGAIFRLIIGVAITESGNRINDAIVYFRQFATENIVEESAALLKDVKGE